MKAQRKVVGWLWEGLAFKMYHLIGSMLICGVAYHGAYSLGSIPQIGGYDIAKDGVLAGTAAWLSIAVILRVIRRQEAERELKTKPLEWSKGASAASALAALIATCLGAPLVSRPYPLTILIASVAALTAATSGIAVYLSIYWDDGLEEKRASPEALKAEHEVWNTIFTCSIIWVGVFIGGVLLSVGIGGTMKGITERFPNVSGEELDRVILYHGVAALYAAVGTILWMLRPVHRRLEQISRAMSRQAG